MVLQSYQESGTFVQTNLTTFSDQSRHGGIRRLLATISHFRRMTIAGAVIHPSLHAAIPTEQNISALAPEQFGTVHPPF